MEDKFKGRYWYCPKCNKAVLNVSEHLYALECSENLSKLREWFDKHKDGVKIETVPSSVFYPDPRKEVN